jgi:hypothetical protein
MSTEEADVRTIHIPAPTHTARLIVRKRLDQHLTGDRLVSGQRGSASRAFSDTLVRAAREATDADARAADTPWSVLWFTHRAGPWFGLERTEEVELACSGPDDGLGLRDRLADALAGEAVDVALLPPSPSVLGDAFPAVARWGRFTFGPKLGSFEGRCVVVAGVEEVEPQSTPPLRCPSCGAVGVPQWEIVGYPSRELEELLVALDEVGICDLALLGCIPPLEPRGPASCANCDQDLFPASETPDEIADRVLDVEGVRVADGFRRLYMSDDRPDSVVWVGSARAVGGVAVFALCRSTLDRLEEDGGLLALRVEGGAVLFADAEDVLAAAAPRECGRARLRVPVAEPLERGARVDGGYVPLRARPWRRPDAVDASGASGPTMACQEPG